MSPSAPEPEATSSSSKRTESAEAAAGAAAPAAPKAPQQQQSSETRAAAAADEDDPTNCPICAYVEQGPCANEHVSWRLCKGAAKREGPEVDWVDKCSTEASVAHLGFVHTLTASRVPLCIAAFVLFHCRAVAFP